MSVHSYDISNICVRFPILLDRCCYIYSVHFFLSALLGYTVVVSYMKIKRAVANLVEETMISRKDVIGILRENGSTGCYTFLDYVIFNFHLVYQKSESHLLDLLGLPP